MGILDNHAGFALFPTVSKKIVHHGFIPDITNYVSIEIQGGPLFVSGGTAFIYSAHLRWDFDQDSQWALYGLGGLGGDITGAALGDDFELCSPVAAREMFVVRASCWSGRSATSSAWRSLQLTASCRWSLTESWLKKPSERSVACEFSPPVSSVVPPTVAALATVKSTSAADKWIPRPRRPVVLSAVEKLFVQSSRAWLRPARAVSQLFASGSSESSSGTRCDWQTCRERRRPRSRAALLPRSSLSGRCRR